MRFCCSFTRRRTSNASRTAHSRSSSPIGASASGCSSLSSPLTVLFTPLMSRPESAPPQKTRPCSAGTRLWLRSWVKHSDKKSLTRPKCSVKSPGFSLGTSQPGRKPWMRSMKAVSLRISGGSGPNRWPMRCWCSTSTSKLPTRTMDPSARMLSLPRENSPRPAASPCVDAASNQPIA